MGYGPWCPRELDMTEWPNMVTVTQQALKGEKPLDFSVGLQTYRNKKPF